MHLLTIEIALPDDGMTPDAFRRKADAFCHEMRVAGCTMYARVMYA